MKCPECDERFVLIREGDVQAQDWYLDVVHNHENTPALWTAVLYSHKKGQRYPATLKESEGRRKAQKARVRDAKRREKARGKGWSERLEWLHD